MRKYGIDGEDERVDVNAVVNAVQKTGEALVQSVGALQKEILEFSQKLREDRDTVVLRQLADVFLMTQVYKVTKGKHSFSRSTLYQWRKGKAFTLTPRFILLLKSLGYRLKLEKIETEERQ